MKVVLISNYDHEMESDTLLAAGLSEAEARLKAKEYNAKQPPNSADYAVVKSDDYQLYRFQP